MLVTRKVDANFCVSAVKHGHASVNNGAGFQVIEVVINYCGVRNDF